MSISTFSAEPPLLEIRNFSLRLGDSKRQTFVVDNLSYRVYAGKTLAIVGESGAGKTLSCRALLGLTPNHATINGSVRFKGKELVGLREREIRSHRGKDIAMVFQDAGRALNPTMRIGKQIVEAICKHKKLNRTTAQHYAIELLRELKLSAPQEQFYDYPHQLSGGMQQRVMMAIAMASNPKLLIADEATRSLDVTTQAQIVNLLKNLQQQRGMGLILISHDLHLAASCADDVLVMRNGRAVEYRPTRQLFESPEHPYTKSLLNAMNFSEQRVKNKRIKTCTALLKVDNLVQEFSTNGYLGNRKGRQVHAVSGVSFELFSGEILGLVGETGSGKSTLARTLLQIPAPKTGTVRFYNRELTQLRGHELHNHRSKMQLVFQDSFASVNPKWRVSSILEEPLLGLKLGTRVQRQRRVAEVLERVGLDPSIYGRRRPHELSGGQCQRVAIARALAPEPNLIIFDEALASLDLLIQVQILELLIQLRADLGLSFLFISHDLNQVYKISDRIAVMYAGKICEIGPTESIFRQPAHAYTKTLLAASPSLNRATVNFEKIGYPA